MDNVNLSLNEVLSNEDVLITLTPSTNTLHYTYVIYKDNQVYKTVSINNKTISNVSLKETGTYQIKITNYNSKNVKSIYKSGNYILDKELPTLNVGETNLEMYVGDKLSVKTVAHDNIDGDISSKVTSNYDELNMNTPGEKVLTYTVTDSAGNSVSKNVEINLLAKSSSLIFFQILTIILLVCLVFNLYKFIKAIKLEKRIKEYTVEPIQDNNISLIETIVLIYQKYSNKFSKITNKSEFAKKYANKLDKYKDVSTIHTNGKEIFGGKFVMGVICLIIAFIAKIIQFELIGLSEIIIIVFAGFMELDVIYFIKYKIYRKKLQNDLLSAIIIMNNAFKSGMSIAQAIELVSKEIEGTIGREFSKMNLELSYGLSISDIFKRFYDRVKIEEIKYLTASLSILNITGGDITKVFTSIEDNLFNKKKLNLELNSLTSSSKLVVWVLLLVPFLFILFISLISPTYFEPFINSKAGIILSVILIIIYCVFAFFVRKIMKVKIDE